MNNRYVYRLVVNGDYETAEDFYSLREVKDRVKYIMFDFETNANDWDSIILPVDWRYNRTKFLIYKHKSGQFTIEVDKMR